MVDIFANSDLIKLLQNKTVMFVGDSNIRTVYKDMVCLYQTNQLMDISHIARNLEETFMGDILLIRQNMYKQRTYVERRIFKADQFTLEFMFVTQCLSPMLIQYLQEIHSSQIKAPDVICMNSFLWDITRWGPKPEKRYIENMSRLVDFLNNCLPKTTLFLWMTTNPVSIYAEGIPFVPQLREIHETLFSDILEGNCFAAKLFQYNGYDIIDTHYHLFKHTFRRAADGIKYLPTAVRYITYLLLTHIALSWDITLPGRIDSTALHEEITLSKEKYCAEESVQHWEESKQQETAAATIQNDHSIESWQQSARCATNMSDNNNPLIRVKSVRELMGDCERTIDNYGEDASASNTILKDTQSKQESFNIKSIRNESFLCSEEDAKFSGSNQLYYENKTDIANNNEITILNGRISEEKKCIKDENDEIKMEKAIEYFEEILEDGEIVDNELVEEQFPVSNWLDCKTEYSIRDSKRDLVTLEIPRYPSGKFHLKAKNYQRWNSNSHYKNPPFRRIQGFIQQLNRKLIRSQSQNRKCSVINSKLLFGYEKNERYELFQPKVCVPTNKLNNGENKGSSISWVAEQWRRVIQAEPQESVEVINYRRNSVQIIENQNDAMENVAEDFYTSSNSKSSKPYSLSFL